MTSKSRKRQLDKLAQRRSSDRQRQRRQRIIAGVVGGVLGVAVIAFVLWAFVLGGDDEPKERAMSQPTPQTGPTATPETGAVACGGEVPANAGEEKPSYDAPPEPALTEGADYTAVMKTSCGTITIDLYEEETPITVNNFVFLSREGFYDGLIFHRVIADFMDQGGDPAGNGTGGPGYQFEDEFVESLTFDRPGLLAMANSGPATNGSQFFITAVPTPHLDGLHTIFGEVVEGLDIVEQINKLPTDASDLPTPPVYIESVKIEEA